MGDDTNFDVKFSALPPELQMKLWVLGLDANTSKVCIAYRPGAFTTSLTSLVSADFRPPLASIPQPGKSIWEWYIGDLTLGHTRISHRNQPD